MADSSINSFMSSFDGGAKPNLYSVNIACPALAGAFQNLQFFCKATSLPSSILGEIPLPYLGRVAKYPGDRVYEDWTVTILNTQDMQLRKVFELWNEMFNTHGGNVALTTNPRQLFGGATVTQLARNYQPVRSYFLAEVWPEIVSGIDLAYEADNQISEFTVTLKYSYFITDTSSSITGVAVAGGNVFQAPGFVGAGAGATQAFNGAQPAFGLNIGGVGFGTGGSAGIPYAGRSSSGGFSFQNKNFGFSIGGSSSSFGPA